MKLDLTDAKILEALMEDGRASLRQIARRTSLTTPTVSARLARMMKAGLIRKFVPLLSPDSVHPGVLALVTIKVDSGSLEKTAKNLAKRGEVEDVYVTTGQSVTLKLSLESVQALHSFMSENLAKKAGVDVVSSQIITHVIKDDPPSLLPSILTMNLKCDYCDGAVTSNRPYTLAAGPSRYYFCCKTCKREYLEMHGARLAGMSHN